LPVFSEIASAYKKGALWDMPRSLTPHVVFTAIALWTVASFSAVAADGLYSGELSCGPAGSSPPFKQAVAVAIRDGAGAWSGGRSGQDGYYVSDVSVGHDGTARVTGHYLVGGDKRPIDLVGQSASRMLSAKGRRGPRDCTLELRRPPVLWTGAAFNLPYDAAIPRTEVGRSQSVRACPPFSGLPRDLEIDAFYRRDDPTHSIIDPERMAAYTAAMKPLRAFESEISAQADAVVRGIPASAPSNCIVTMLDAAARANALLGKVSPQGAYVRKWSAITYAFAFIEARAAASDDQARHIMNWLRTIGDRVAGYYMLPPTSPMSDRANNHAYWAALSAAASGMAADDADLFDWGMNRFLSALDDIDSDGFLALELNRAGRALHYHRFSLEPLLLLGLIARANGIEISSARRAALGRLIARVQSGLDDPSVFAERTNTIQQPAGGTRGDWAWAELALAWTAEPALEARISPLRPLGARWLGGNLSLRYARP